jgi:hypothetical protein
MRLEKFPSHFHYGGNSIRKPGAGVGEEVGEEEEGRDTQKALS